MVKIYVAGKISNNSAFGTHHWRDNFCEELEKISGVKINNIDPTKKGIYEGDVRSVFGCDCYLVSMSDVVIVYLSDDISIGGCQEIMIAKYLGKPVIGLAPYGGKFNGAEKMYGDKLVKNYKDPFAFSTCDVVCGNIEEVGETLKDIRKIKPKTLSIIDESIKHYLDFKDNQASVS